MYVYTKVVSITIAHGTIPLKEHLKLFGSIIYICYGKLPLTVSVRGRDIIPTIVLSMSAIATCEMCL